MGEYQVIDVKNKFCVVQVMESYKTREEAEQRKTKYIKNDEQNEFQKALKEARRKRFF